MKAVIEIFKNKKSIFKELKAIDLKKFGIKKRYEVYEAVDIKNRYVLIFNVKRKSRFISKNARDLIEIYKNILDSKEHSYRFIYVLFFSPYCSKTKNILKEEGFKILDAIV